MQRSKTWTCRTGTLTNASTAGRVAYPTFPHVLDEESLAAIATLEKGERAFAERVRPPRQRYLLGLYLKAIQHLGHAHYQPGDLPRQLRLRVARQLRVDDRLANLRKIDKSEKSRVVAEVRGFVSLRPVTRDDKDAMLEWLTENIAAKETDLALLVQAAIERWRDQRVELPPSSEVANLAKKALTGADAAVLDQIHRDLDAGDAARLDTILTAEKRRTPLEHFKAPAPMATANSLAGELKRLEDIQGHLPRGTPLARISRRKVDRLAQLAGRYNASELRQLRPARRHALLLCFVVTRHAEMLDTVVDVTIRVWDQAKASASGHANEQQQLLAKSYERYHSILRELLAIISASKSEHELWRGIHTYKSGNEFETLHEEIKNSPSWNQNYIEKIEDHYTTLRRFLPDLYRLLPVCSTSTDDTLPRAIRFADKHAKPGVKILPLDGCPTDFLTPPWEGRAVKRQRNTQRIAWVRKVPYELGLVEATTGGLKSGTLAIKKARRYAPMTDHLLPREEFLAGYGEYAARLGHPADAAEHYEPLRNELADGLGRFDRQYRTNQRTFWIHPDGRLGFSRLPGQSAPRRMKKVARKLAEALSEVSILDILLDCHRWTGFLNHFRPAAGRQNMPESERLPQVLGALYAYGCNCGPTQAARAIGLSKNQVIYMRRRYMATESLMNAAQALADAYQRTPAARRLGDPGVLMTDSMQVRTLKDSLIARQHHRYRDGKSTLLYQHVTANCVCVFTQALLCNVSEAIHMLVGALHCRTGEDPLINICDSAGKSDLVFGLASLLNIELYPRVRSSNLKIWGPGDSAEYTNIENAITGQINWSRIDKNWQDMMWILASIEAGTAKPALILERLVAQPKHPASVGFEELGKLRRSLYLLRYGMDLDVRRFVVPYTSRREHWNKFTREVLAFGDLLREKTLEDQEEVFWFLTVVQNAIVLWNVLALDQAVEKVAVDEEDLAHILPTMTEHINFVGRFDLDLRRKPPFKLRLAS